MYLYFAFEFLFIAERSLRRNHFARTDGRTGTSCTAGPTADANIVKRIVLKAIRAATDAVDVPNYRIEELRLVYALRFPERMI